jgi:predicted transglutaminase-like cysteine proteinase
VYYIIDSKYRKSVELTKWLTEQLRRARASPEIVELAKKLKGSTDDITMSNIFNFVRKNYTWTSDKDLWDRVEYWEDVDKVFFSKKKKCDCESGALLMYCLARLNNIPKEALYIWCGDMKYPNSTDTFGHAVLLYKQIQFPLNWTFADWCNYANTKSLKTRGQFTVMGKTLHEYHKTNDNHWLKVDSVYVNTWFAFNEKKSFRYFR